ncbi:hypothetical protein T11_11652 [Trichinella zimbabwensis]|uniref:Uncharacterized protein n=1 Tax=Trichinella zimbabwensis TaxID=268475 RepID=A0A0V1GKB6_9BILA|nr:hypothetical protein T11_11652 [Trichinella zimbabwensis]
MALNFIPNIYSRISLRALCFLLCNATICRFSCRNTLRRVLTNNVQSLELRFSVHEFSLLLLS